jgi:hypothetical protein
MSLHVEVRDANNTLIAKYDMNEAGDFVDANGQTVDLDGQALDAPHDCPDCGRPVGPSLDDRVEVVDRIIKLVEAARLLDENEESGPASDLADEALDGATDNIITGMLYSMSRTILAAVGGGSRFETLDELREFMTNDVLHVNDTRPCTPAEVTE